MLLFCKYWVIFAYVGARHYLICIVREESGSLQPFQCLILATFEHLYRKVILKQGQIFCALCFKSDQFNKNVLCDFDRRIKLEIEQLFCKMLLTSVSKRGLASVYRKKFPYGKWLKIVSIKRDSSAYQALPSHTCRAWKWKQVKKQPANLGKVLLV